MGEKKENKKLKINVDVPDMWSKLVKVVDVIYIYIIIIIFFVFCWGGGGMLKDYLAED